MRGALLAVVRVSHLPAPVAGMAPRVTVRARFGVDPQPIGFVELCDGDEPIIQVRRRTGDPVEVVTRNWTGPVGRIELVAFARHLLQMLGDTGPSG